MARVILALAIGILAGGAGSWYVLHESTALKNGSLSVTKQSTLPASDADTQRERGFESLNSIDEILTLASDFDQTEALFVLAGRSNSRDVQDLIGQAQTISDARDRRAALSILFSRLADIDPLTAVALSAQPEFAHEQAVLSAVWRSWADDSPIRAINFINEMASARERQSASQSLGGQMGHVELDELKQLAKNFDRDMDRRNFLTSARNAVAASFPGRLIEGWLTDRSTFVPYGQNGVAAQKIAQQDVAQAIRYYDQATDNQMLRAMLASGIVQELATTDPLLAVRWAQENDSNGSQSLLMQAVMVISQTDPAAAMEILRADDGIAVQQKQMITTMVVSNIALQNPEMGIAILESLPTGVDKNQAAQQVVSAWAQTDPQAALGWALEHKQEFGESILRQAGQMLIMRDPRSVISVLPQLDDATAKSWSVQIVSRLAQLESVEAAMNLMQQFEGQPHYAQMQAALVPQVAQTDLARAKSMADEMSPGQEKNQALAYVIGEKAKSEPAVAIGWLDAMSDGRARSGATSNLVINWMNSDPSAARRWVNSLPNGESRDHAVLALVNFDSNDGGDAPMQLIDSIENDALRQQAKMSYFYRLARFDRDKAEALLKTMRLSPEQRAQLEQMLGGVGSMHGSSIRLQQ